MTTLEACMPSYAYWVMQVPMEALPVLERPQPFVMSLPSANAQVCVASSNTQVCPSNSNGQASFPNFNTHVSFSADAWAVAASPSFQFLATQHMAALPGDSVVQPHASLASYATTTSSDCPSPAASVGANVPRVPTPCEQSEATAAAPAKARRGRAMARRGRAMATVWSDPPLAHEDVPGSHPPRALQPAARRGVRGVAMAASGDEWCVQLLRGLEAGGEARAAAIGMLKGSVREMALDAVECRLVQRGLEVVDSVTARSLAEELRGHVREVVASPHGNYVLQKVIEMVPSAITGFVSQELCGIEGEVARHRYGCRILCRLVERSSDEPAISKLLDEMLKEAAALCQHPFARHVLQSLLEHGNGAQRKRIAEALRGNVCQLAANRSGSYVVESALLNCEEEQQELSAELLSNPHALPALADHGFGCFVVRALSQISEESRDVVLRSLRMAAEQLKAFGPAQKLLEELEAERLRSSAR